MAEEWKELLKFNCTLCGNCCREPIVLVTDEDIRRIVAHTKDPVEEIVKFYKPSQIEWSTKNPGWIKLKAGKRILGLQQTDNGCKYLGEDDLCTIYEHRPITCRRYPFNLEIDENQEIEMLSISDAVECPYDLEGNNTLEELKVICDWEEREEEPYFELVTEWNKKKKGGGKKKFLKHIGF